MCTHISTTLATSVFLNEFYCDRKVWVEKNLNLQYFNKIRKFCEEIHLYKLNTCTYIYIGAFVQKFNFQIPGEEGFVDCVHVRVMFVFAIPYQKQNTYYTRIICAIIRYAIKYLKNNIHNTYPSAPAIRKRDHIFPYRRISVYAIIPRRDKMYTARVVSLDNKNYFYMRILNIQFSRQFSVNKI